MKRLLFLLFLIPSIAFGQSIFKFTPVVSTTAISCSTTSGSALIMAEETDGFADNLTAGMQVWGSGVPWGTVVVSCTDSDWVSVSKNSTASADSVSLRFGYFTSLQYGSGDALGFPLDLGYIQKINEIYIVDDDDQLGAAKIVFFDSTFTAPVDNSAFGIADADNDKIIGYVSLSVTENWDTNSFTTAAATQLPMYFPPATHVYAQLIATSTPTFTKVSPLRLIIVCDGQ